MSLSGNRSYDRSLAETGESFSTGLSSSLTLFDGLAVPVVVIQVGLMLMGVVDVMVVGRVSAEALAAVAEPPAVVAQLPTWESRATRW